MSTQRIRILSSLRRATGVRLVIQKLNTLDGEILHEWRPQIPGKLLVEAFRVEIGIAGNRRALPQIGKFSGGQRYPLVRHWVVRDPRLVECNGLAIEEVGQRFICSSRIAERTGSQVNPAGEVFVQLAIKTEAHP